MGRPKPNLQEQGRDAGSRFEVAVKESERNPAAQLLYHNPDLHVAQANQDRCNLINDLADRDIYVSQVEMGMY